MSLDSLFQTGLATIAGLTGTVPVVYDGVSGNGVDVQSDEDTVFTDRGEEGVVTGVVRVSAATWTNRPDRGKTILVNGASVIVMGARTSGGIHRIEYRVKRSVSGV